MTKKVGNISRREYTVFDTINNVSDNGKLFNIIEDLNDKGFMFKYNGEWITKDDCKHFLSDDTSGISIDLYHDVQGNSNKQSPKISKPVRKYSEQGKFVFDSRKIKSSYSPKKITAKSKEEFYNEIENLGYEIFEDDGKWLTLENFPNVYEAEYTRYSDGDYELMLYNIHKTGNRIESSRRNKIIKSAYTREDYDRFDEKGNFIPYQPTEEELAKKDEIKTVLRQELSDAHEPDPMDNYAGYDSTNERIDMACERVAKQFGVDTDFVEEIAGEIDRENIARAQAEPEYVYQHCKDKDRFWDWYNGEDVSLEELGIDKEQMDREVDEVVHKYVNSSRQIKSSLSDILQDEEALQYFTVEELQKMNYEEWLLKKITADEHTENDNLITKLYKKHMINSSRQIKSSIITPWDTNQVTGTSDEDLGLSAVVDIYGNEFVNVDESTLNELKDTLVRYFDDEAYVRDWNINNPDYQIEDAFEVTDPEEMSAEDLARYFDYEAYGRDIRLEDNMVWDSDNQYWISAHDVDDEELNNDKYVFMRG